MAARAALAAFAACAFSGVAAIETVRGGVRARAAGAPPPDAATLAAAMGGKAPTVVRVEAGSALGDALAAVAGGADTYISAASLIIPESCSAAGTVAKVAGDAAPALRIVVALSGSQCAVGAWLPPSVTGVPAAATASVARTLAVEFDSAGLVSYTLYGEQQSGGTLAFPGSWLNAVQLSSPAPFVTVSAFDFSAVSGSVGAVSSGSLLPANTPATVTLDASGAGSTLRASSTAATTVLGLVKAAGGAAGVDVSAVAPLLNIVGLSKLSLTATTSAVVYSAKLSGSAVDVASAAATGSMSFGARLSSTVTLGGGVSAQVEVVAALLGSGGVDPSLVALLASGDPGAVAKAMGDAALAAGSDAAGAAADSAQASATDAGNAAASRVSKGVTCRIDARVKASEGGVKRKPRKRGDSLACKPLAPSKADAKAMLAKAVKKTAGAAKSSLAASASSALAAAGSAPKWQPVAWAGVSLRADSLAGVFKALKLDKVPGLAQVTQLLAMFLPAGPVSAVAAAATDDADLAQLPADVVPDALALLGGGTAVTQGLTVSVSVAPPAACAGGAGALLCKFLQTALGRGPNAKPLRLVNSIPKGLAGVTASIQIDSIPLGKGVVLQQVALNAVAEPPSLGISAALSLPVQGETLLLTASISEGVGMLNLAASMVGVWRGAFGWKQLDVANLALSTSITMTVPPVPKSFMFQGSAAAYAPGVAHDGCAPGSPAASTSPQKCFGFTVAMGWDAAPPAAWFYASLTSVQVGHGLTMGALPCIFAGACLGSDDPLDVVLNSVAITAATVSMADAPQVLMDGTAVPVGLSLAGAASIGGIVDIALNINIDAKTGSAKVAAKAGAGSALSLAFAGGFVSGNPSQSYVYAAFSVKVNVPKALCSLGKVCSLPRDVATMLGSGDIYVSVAMSRAAEARTVALAGSTATVDIPAGLKIDTRLNFFDFIKADASFLLTQSGSLAATITLGKVEFGGAMLCATSACEAGPTFSATLPFGCKGSECAPYTASLEAYAKLFGAVFSVKALIAADSQTITANGLAAMGMSWAVDLGMKGKLGAPSKIHLALTLSPSDLRKIEQEIVGFLGEALDALENAGKAVAKEAKKIAGEVRSGAKKVGRGLKKAGKELSRGAKSAVGKASRGVKNAAKKAKRMFHRFREGGLQEGADAEDAGAANAEDAGAADNVAAADAAAVSAANVAAAADADAASAASAAAAADADANAAIAALTDAASVADAAGDGNADAAVAANADAGVAANADAAVATGADAGAAGAADAADAVVTDAESAGLQLAESAPASRSSFALRSITAGIDVAAKHVKGGLDMNAAIDLHIAFAVGGKSQKMGFTASLNSKSLGKDIANALKKELKNLKI